MPIRKAVFPVAGMGTRLLPATKSQPKEMLPVGYKPVVQYVVEEMVEQGLSKFLFITGRKKRSIEDHFDADPELEARLSGKDQVVDEVDYSAQGVEFYYARQRRPDGNADAVRLAREFVGNESFVVAFGDTIIYSPDTPRVIERMVDSHERHQSVATIGVWEVPREETRKYGVVQPTGEIGDDFAIRDIVEKPEPSEAPSCLAVAARYIFTPDIFSAIDSLEPGLGGELWLTDAIRILLLRGAPVRCVRLNGVEKRYDIGMPLTYYKAFADFALRDPEHGDDFRVYLRDKLAGK
ncbi:MAG: UTP--glucose-1-phosphate uridylyltransferase [Candidatus Latescibacterota bacterium]|nr:UTP--glucose-1-phosphate uridylyltransferase [Candidatus Latescibacterota bacterium]MEE2627570.1 UTP--glucose-1-phosphate uridylyltransferase [Candidatus Latescibacterota bacterium]MEE2725567.1 UTP--glucose-1-phosphate uridylyltransferase [Candidatus Latescibacterota bacterium]